MEEEEPPAVRELRAFVCGALGFASAEKKAAVLKECLDAGCMSPDDVRRLGDDQLAKFGFSALSLERLRPSSAVTVNNHAPVLTQVFAGGQVQVETAVQFVSYYCSGRFEDEEAQQLRDFCAMLSEKHLAVAPPSFVEDEGAAWEEDRLGDGLEQGLKAVPPARMGLREGVGRCLDNVRQRAERLKEGHAAWRITKEMQNRYMGFTLEDFGCGDASIARTAIGGGFVRLCVAAWGDEGGDHHHHEGGRMVDVADIWQDAVQRVVVLGEAGAGKTTLLKKMACDWATRGLWRDWFDVVIFLRLRDVRREARGGSLTDLLVSGLLGNDERRREEAELFLSWLDRDKRAERTLWILDGWDEVGTPLGGSALEAITQGTQKRVLFLLAGLRFEAAKHLIGINAKLTVMGFSSQGVREFLQMYFGTDVARRKHLEHVLESGWLKDACRLPLMLRLVCLVSGGLTKEDAVIRRTDVYGRVVLHLLDRYFEVANKAGIPAEANKGSLRRELRRLAWEGFSARVDGGDPILLEEDVRRCGLVRSLGYDGARESFAWVHRTLQEYLAAEHICFAQEEKTGVELTRVWKEMSERSSVFFGFVCGLGGRAAKCWGDWMPNHAWIHLQDVTHWLEDGSEALFVFLRDHWKGVPQNSLVGLLRSASARGNDRVAELCVELLGPTANLDMRDRGKATALMLACLGGHVEVVRLLLDHGASVQALSDTGATPLHYAVRSGSLAVVQSVICHWKVACPSVALVDAQMRGDAQSKYRVDAGSIQEEAPRTGTRSVQIAGEVSASSAPLKARRRGDTSLHLACEIGLPEIAQALLENGASPWLPGTLGKSVRKLALMHGQKRIAALALFTMVITRPGAADFFLGAEEVDEEDMQILVAGRRTAPVMYNGEDRFATFLHVMLFHWVARQSVSMVALLLDSGAEVNARNSSGETPLFHLRQVELANLLLARGADVNFRDVHGWTALYVSVKDGRSEMVSLLLLHGANVCLGSTVDQTMPLHVSSQNGHARVAVLLLEGGADPNAIDKNGWTPLHMGSQNGHVEVVVALIERGVPLNAVTNVGWTALHLACQKGHFRVAGMLLERGANPNVRGNDRNTALHISSQHGFAPVAKLLAELLLKHGADANLADANGCTALHWASSKGHSRLVRLLLGQGATVEAVNDAGQTALHLASHQGHCDVVRELLGRKANDWTGVFSGLPSAKREQGAEQEANVNAADNNGWTALHLASQNGHVEVVRLLLGRGANMNAFNKYGGSALHCACHNENGEVVKLLLERGADVSMVDKHGRSVLHSACKYGRIEMVRLLVELGVDCSQADAVGANGLHFACAGGHQSVVEFLIGRCPALQAMVTKEGLTPAACASLNEHLTIVDLLSRDGASAAPPTLLFQQGVLCDKGHALKVRARGLGWICNECRDTPLSMVSHCCFECDYDNCAKCAKGRAPSKCILA